MSTIRGNMGTDGTGTGRFGSLDPSTGVRLGDPASWNRYTYVGGDPINRIDPAGTAWVCVGYSDDLSCYDDGSGDQNGGAGGTGKAGTPKPNDPADYPACNPSGNALTETKLDFISANWGAAMAEANSIQNDLKGTKVDTSALATMLIQWSAWESHYMTDAGNMAENNAFGAQNPSNVPGAWNGTAVACARGTGAIPANSKNACFDQSLTWGQELTAVLASASGKTTATYLSALESALKSGASMSGALQAISDNGWNGAGYGSTITSGIQIQSQVSCLKRNGSIQ